MHPAVTERFVWMLHRSRNADTPAIPKNNRCRDPAERYAVRPGTRSTNTASVIQQPVKGAFDCRER